MQRISVSVCNDESADSVEFETNVFSFLVMISTVMSFIGHIWGNDADDDPEVGFYKGWDIG